MVERSEFDEESVVRYRMAWIGAFALCAACDPGPAVPGGLTVRDSAGVTLHEAAPAAEAVVWSVGAAPALRVGGEGDPHAGPPFRVRSGRFFDDGSFVVAEAGAGRLRFYTAGGSPRRTVGGEGEGLPGALGATGFLQVVGDSVWAYDASRRRIAVLGRDGGLARLVALDSASLDGPVMARGVFADGAVLVGRREAPDGAGPGAGMVFERLHRLDPDARTTTDFGRFPVAGSPPGDRGDAPADPGRPDRRRGLVAVHGMDWFYSDGGALRIERYDPIGQVEAVYARRAAGASAGEDGGEGPPAYEGLIVERGGDVWARRPAAGARPGCWDVYQGEPALLAEACLPEGSTVLDVAGTSVLALLRDALGTEHVVVYRLSKG